VSSMQVGSHRVAAQGWSREEVLAAYCKAMADRIFSLVERSGLNPALR